MRQEAEPIDSAIINDPTCPPLKKLHRFFDTRSPLENRAQGLHSLAGKSVVRR